MSVLIKNIHELLQVRNEPTPFVAGSDMKKLPRLEDAFLLIEDDTIVDFGLMKDLGNLDADSIIDASGKLVLPAWCDSHTHLVFAEYREQEFVQRIQGLSYEEIAESGGGILNSARRLRQASEDELYKAAAVRLNEAMQMGTGAIEIKSGYGLDLDSELKMLRVINRLKADFPIKVVPTFLGAHAVPEAYQDDKKAYVDHIIRDIIPAVAEQNIAHFIDVFCERGYFSTDDLDRILKAGAKYGLRPKVHVNQFSSIGGISVAAENNALTVDHLEVLTEQDLQALKNSKTMAVALPLCSFFLGIPYTNARKIIDEGIPLALATDFNPGSSPSANMNQVLSTACIKMNMFPEEAINALTINGAYAMGVDDLYGSIAKGKKANIIITKPLENISLLPYLFGDNLIEQVLINGEPIKKPRE